MACDTILEKIKMIPIDNDNADIYKRISTTLTDLKSYIEFYLDKVFNNKSLLENDIMFNKYLAILNGIKNVLKTVQEQREKELENNKNDD